MDLVSATSRDSKASYDEKPLCQQWVPPAWYQTIWTSKEINVRVKITDRSTKRAQLHSETTELGILRLSS